MGGEANKATKEKESKTPSASTTQEQPGATTAAVNPDWSGFQAYSPIPPHGFLAQTPQAHPYMWGVQHIMPPYGTPPHPYVAMYPHGGMYAHPSMPPGSYPFSPFAMPSPNGIPEASGNTPGSVEADNRSSEVKEKLPIKRSKGSLGSLNVITGKNSEHGKVRETPANGVYKSAESGSVGSSEGSDADSQNDSQNKSGGGQDSLEDGSQNGGSLNGSQNGGQGTPSSIINTSLAVVPISSASPVPGPATNLNIGMDYWGAPAMHGKVSPAPMPGGLAAGGSRDGVQPQVWLQDERELKRQRRKQSNRESARRSRLRKQAECDELAQRAGALKEENDNLRSEVNRIKSEFEKLLAENASLKERLGEGSGHEHDDVGAGKNDQTPSNNTTQQTG